MARKVRQMRRKGKQVSLVPAPVTTAPDVDARVALIQALSPVALDRVREELEADVERLAGARYARDGRLPGHVRWTRQRGSVYLVWCRADSFTVNYTNECLGIGASAACHCKEALETRH